MFEGNKQSIIEELIIKWKAPPWDDLDEATQEAISHNTDVIIEQREAAVEAELAVPEPALVKKDTLGLPPEDKVEEKQETAPPPPSEPPKIPELKPGQYYCTKCKAVHANRETSKIGKKHLRFSLDTVKAVGSPTEAAAELLKGRSKGVTEEEANQVFEEE